jgi:hypothetical protein
MQKDIGQTISSILSNLVKFINEVPETLRILSFPNYPSSISPDNNVEVEVLS